MKYRNASIAWGLVTLWLLLMPVDAGGTKLFEHQDKVAHLGLFSVGSFLAYRFLNYECLFSRRRTVLVITIFGIILAGLTEYLQRIIPRRSADIADFLVDLVGIAVAIFFQKLVEKSNHSLPN
ncbi:MAG: VanZ family protein [Cyclobacteriaceae bacterium]|nr:VanZ family protein [Cyclobacteriaceae bacterium HetDA_MAG_MS6]